MPDVSWAAYVRARGLVFPPEWKTWGDIPKKDARRLTRNWRRWQRRRVAIRVVLNAPSDRVPVEALSDWPEAETISGTFRGFWADG